MGKKIQKKKPSTVFKLIDKDEDYFSEKAEQALREIFSRYDLDKDQCLNDKELDNFAIGCNGKPFDKVSIEEIKENFDINSKGWLTIRGFLEMYYMQTLSEPTETWKDINKHGYDMKCNLIKKDETTTTTTTTTSTTATTATPTSNENASTTTTTKTTENNESGDEESGDEESGEVEEESTTTA